MAIQTIGFDKVNQLRHVRFFKNLDGVKKQMRRHASILRPKFELVEQVFKNELTGLANWTKPNGGYFITLFVDGYAKEVIQRCKECGIVLTEAGCAFPYHIDPFNSVIRIAPSFSCIDDLFLASTILCLCVKIEHLLKMLKKEGC